MDREIPKLRLYYYINLRVCVCKTYLTFTLALKKDANQSFSHLKKNNRSSHSDIVITKDSIILNESKTLT
jgi:hypothetical protein